MIFRQCKQYFLIILGLSFFTVSPIALAATLETELSSDQISIGESVTVSYTLKNNSSRHSPDFSVLQKDFEIINTNYGNAISMVNGVTSVQTFWRLQLMPKKSGELWIPAITFGNDQSTPHKLRVTASPITQNTQRTQNTDTGLKQHPSVFVHGEINTHAPYVESQFIYTFKLFFRTQLKSPSIAFPSVKDFTFFELEDKPDYQTTINGEAYHVVEKRFAVFPKKSGNMVLSPMQLHAFVMDESNNLYDDLFYFSEPKPITLSTEKFNLSVQDIPTNYQASTWLPAKNIALTQTWSETRDTWEAGSPVIRTLRVSAQGLRGDQLPDLSIPQIDGMNVYVDKPKLSNITQGNSIVGILEQKVTYIPNKSQSFDIPSIKLNWWNTETNRNAVSQLNGFTINVKGVNTKVHRPLQNIVTPTTSGMKSLSVTTKPTLSNPYYKSIWFWITCFLSGIWIATIWFIFRRKSIATIPETESQSTEISDKEFEQACHTGQALHAQRYLLTWAKKHWPHTQLNLTTLRQIIPDQQFNAAISELEQVIYARKNKNWRGRELLAAFHHIKKSCQYLPPAANKSSAQVHSESDPLPPLNPTC